MRPADHSRAYERLDEILAREEYQDFVSPWATLGEILEKISHWFSGLGLPVQIAVLAVLVVILSAILFHFVVVFRRALRSGPSGEDQPRDQPGRVGDLAGWEALARQARSCLEAGDRAGALRLFYLAAVSRLREIGRIPRSTALTGREILARTRPPLQGLDEATWIFERCVYGGSPPADDEVGAVQTLCERIS